MRKRCQLINVDVEQRIKSKKIKGSREHEHPARRGSLFKTVTDFSFLVKLLEIWSQFCKNNVND